jgi:hypothetical protein
VPTGKPLLATGGRPPRGGGGGRVWVGGWENCTGRTTRPAHYGKVSPFTTGVNGRLPSGSPRPTSLAYLLLKRADSCHSERDALWHVVLGGGGGGFATRVHLCHMVPHDFVNCPHVCVRSGVLVESAWQDI